VRLTTAVTLVNIYQALFEILGKRGCNERYIGAFPINHSGTVIVIEVYSRYSLVVFLEPSLNETAIVIL
jgi:hypothetical protein